MTRQDIINLISGYLANQAEPGFIFDPISEGLLAEMDKAGLAIVPKLPTIEMVTKIIEMTGRGSEPYYVDIFRIMVTAFNDPSKLEDGE